VFPNSNINRYGVIIGRTCSVIEYFERFCRMNVVNYRFDSIRETRKYVARTRITRVTGNPAGVVILSTRAFEFLPRDEKTNFDGQSSSTHGQERRRHARKRTSTGAECTDLRSHCVAAKVGHGVSSP